MIRRRYKRHRTYSRYYWQRLVIRTGISFGSALAMILSYVKNNSIVWAIIHGILSWAYVIYRIFVDYGLING